MIPGYILFAVGLVGILCCAAPALVALLLYKKRGGTASSFFWGSLMYIAFNVMLSYTLGSLVMLTPMADKLWFTVLFSGLSTALLDGFARLAAFRWMMKQSLSPINAMLFGLGYGWLDSLLLLGLDTIYIAAFGAAVNRDPAALDALGDPELVEAVTQQLLTIDLGQLAASCADRLLAVVMQMAFAQLMITAVAKRKGGYTILAFVVQHLCICAIVWVGEVTQNMLLSLAIRVVFAAVAVLLALHTKALWDEPEEEAPGLAQTWNARLPRRPQ